MDEIERRLMWLIDTSTDPDTAYEYSLHLKQYQEYYQIPEKGKVNGKSNTN